MEDIVFRRGLVNRSKGRIRIEENMVTLTVPNKWAGVRTERISVAHIASVEGVTVYHYQRPLAAVLFLAVDVIGNSNKMNPILPEHYLGVKAGLQVVSADPT